MKTRGEIEAAICQGMSRFQQDFMGRGPKDIHAHLIVLGRSRGVLTNAEQHLLKSLPSEKRPRPAQLSPTTIDRTSAADCGEMIHKATGTRLLPGSGNA